MFAAAAAVSISILGWQISRNPAPKLYFQMAILIGKSRPRVNIIIWETSAGAAAPKTASAELKKHKGSRGGDEPWSGGDPFGLPARIRRHVGRGNRREGGGVGQVGRVSIRRVGGFNQVGADDATTSWSSPGATGRWSHLLPPTSPGLSKFQTSWGQVIRARVSTTNGSSQTQAASDPKYSFVRGSTRAK